MRMRSTRAKPAPPAADSTAPRPVHLGPLREFVGYRLRRAQLSVLAGFELALRELGLSPGQLSVLMVIAHNEGLTQSDVCAALGIQRANFTPLLHDLEARGYAIREVLPADRRSNTLRLTLLGREAVARALALHERLEKRITRCLGATGRSQLIELLQKLEAL
ncbi:MAG: winged helix-turn-helix transcriptional regulator [Proteobacteria bacterium]|nr:winged helix-turn-helix transcriptional regulator [Pseudomonadota bacterium]